MRNSAPSRRRSQPSAPCSWPTTPRSQSSSPRVAGRLGLTVPGGVSREQAVILRRLTRLSGPAIDEAFLTVQIAAHVRAIAFNVRVGTDPRLNVELAELAIAGSPILVRHLREARVLRAAQDD